MDVEAGNRSIKRRLLSFSQLTIATSLGVILILIFGFTTLFKTKAAQDRSSDILLYLEKAAGNINELSDTFQTYLLTPEESGAWDERDIYETSALSFLSLAEETASNPEMIEAIRVIKKFVEEPLPGLEKEFEKKMKQDPAKAKLYYLNTYVPTMQEFDAKINLARSKASDINDGYATRIKNTLYLVVILTFGLIIANGIILVRKSQNTAKTVTELLEQICSGLVRNAKTVQDASHHVETSSTTLAQAAGEQASSQQETAASIEEILRILTKNAQHAAANLEICQKGQQETVHGKQVVSALKVSMEDILSLNARLENLIKIISDIDAKTNVINDIAFQTKILSFNASVEAARSGEHGKGFAVVAEEVGKLSALSKDAAEEIKQLISTSSGAVTEVVRVTQEKINNVKGVSTQVTELFDSFYKVMGQIMIATEAMTTAAMEQQTGIEQIKVTMTEVGHATEVTNDNSEKLAAYARGLASESEAMQTSVHRLNVLINEDESVKNLEN